MTEITPSTSIHPSSKIANPPVLGPVNPEPFLKRPFDILVALLGLITSSPLWLAIAIAIKLEGGGPIFYTQSRWGRGGQPFKAYKFRTMTADIDKLHGVRPANEQAAHITRVGAVLRKMGLDELPQFLNILKGDMSMVGPRALAVDETVDDGKGGRIRYADLPAFLPRQAARPGLTSLATIYVSKYSPVRRKFRYDMLYIRNCTFALDMRLILLSVLISFRGKWEDRDRKI
jgi:lipopolysaccharide/colanic/teichoic acid biosynthesis glycosyltransferase